MKLVRGAWKLLVGIILFFGGLFAALNARPGAKPIADGALLLKLDGAIVEQPSDGGALASLSGQDAAHQFRLRDLVRAIDAARTDKRVKAIALDLDAFGGAATAASRCSPTRPPTPTAPIASPATPARSGSIRWAARC